MEVVLPEGKYILAVSGGVDSMVLLNLLVKKPGIEIIVAHFNHGIRPDSADDEKLVVATANKADLCLEVSHGNLGPIASEEQARNARYDFFRSVKMKYRAKAIVTAHHQDDLIETAILNTLRGTNRKGIDAIIRGGEVIRPLLAYTKQDILNYARQNKLKWREDSTNRDIKYLRNRIRISLATTLTKEERQKLICQIDNIAKINTQIDQNIAKISQQLYKRSRVNRKQFANLPVAIGNELIYHWLSELKVQNPNKGSIYLLNSLIRTSKAGTFRSINKFLTVEFTPKYAKFVQSVK